ncbi:MAG: hypothetical protein HYW03_14045 [Deltaproteobacteria bacterium]|nr:hypothetical protein [Deltaproteobacteria bacterium]
MKSGSPTLRSAILALKKELQNLRKEILEEKEQRVLGAIIRRGLRCYPREEDRGVLLPSAKRFREDFYSHLKKYSCSERSAEDYLRFLVRVGVVVPMRQSRFMLKDPRISSFGETLEWFVCQILEKEFNLPSLWGFRVKENRGGGDFDVVALMEGSLVYVETKSSPPKHIEQRDIQAFFDRLEVLAPDLAIYLEDTQLRMKDKIAIMFEKELRRRFGSSWREGHPLNRLRRETFGIEDRLFITNSDPDLIANLGFCLGRYLRSRAAKIGGGKEAILWGP